MKKKRKIVETVTEVVLATILLAIFAFTFAVVWSLNPVSSPKEKQVLGAQISAVPFETLQSNLFEQTNLIASRNSLNADYTFAVSHINPEQTYNLVKLSNNSSEERKYAVSLSISEEDIKWFKVSGMIDDVEYPIYDALGDEQVYDLVVSLQPNTERTFNLFVKSYSEEAPTELNAHLSLEVITD